MKDYYRILGVPADSTTQQIRNAWRTRAKTVHPDKVGDSGNAEFLALNEAREILSSKTSRESYDRVYRAQNMGQTDSWNYRDFLVARADQPEFLARLVCFDLLHDNEQQAADLYQTSHDSGFFSLGDHLDREDFMDYGFLLSEVFLERGAVVKAYKLLKGIAELEEQKPWFRHFYPEVLDRLCSIASGPLPEDHGQEHEQGSLRLMLLNHVISLTLPPKKEAEMRKILSEQYSALGFQDKATEQIFRAWELYPKLPGLKQTVDELKNLQSQLQNLA